MLLNIGNPNISRYTIRCTRFSCTGDAEHTEILFFKRFLFPFFRLQAIEPYRAHTFFIFVQVHKQSDIACTFVLGGPPVSSFHIPSLFHFSLLEQNTKKSNPKILVTALFRSHKKKWIIFDRIEIHMVEVRRKYLFIWEFRRFEIVGTFLWIQRLDP